MNQNLKLAAGVAAVYVGGFEMARIGIDAAAHALRKFGLSIQNLNHELQLAFGTRKEK